MVLASSVHVSLQLVHQHSVETVWVRLVERAGARVSDESVPGEEILASCGCKWIKGLQGPSAGRLSSLEKSQ